MKENNLKLYLFGITMIVSDFVNFQFDLCHINSCYNLLTFWTRVNIGMLAC